MRKTVLLLLLVLTATQGLAQRRHQFLCTHEVQYDESDRYLSWYKPQVPGVGYDKVMRLAAEYIKSGCPVDPNNGLKVYMTHCSIIKPKKGNLDDYHAGKTGSKWPHNPAGLYAGLVQSLAVDFRVYSGDDSYLNIVRELLDYQLEHGTTPGNYAWANCPYSSSDPGATKYEGAEILDKKFDKTNVANYRCAGDGKGVLQPDKVAELGNGYLKFYQITEEKKYLKAALDCADALAWHVRDVPTEWYVRAGQMQVFPQNVKKRSGGLGGDSFLLTIYDEARCYFHGHPPQIMNQ